PPSFCPVFPFLFFDAVDYPDLHSFPTRRSSDLTCSDPPVSTGRLPTLRDPGGAAEHGCLGQPCARPPLVDMGRRAARSGQPPAHRGLPACLATVAPEARETGRHDVLTERSSICDHRRTGLRLWAADAGAVMISCACASPPCRSRPSTHLRCRWASSISGLRTPART